MRREAFIALRKARGYSQLSLANDVGCDRTTVRRWENGESDVASHYRSPLANALGITLEDLAKLLNGNNDLTLLSGSWFSTFEVLEQSALVSRSWEVAVVQGLLQTKSYALALLKNEQRVKQRLERQHILTRDNPVELRAIIDESVLFRPIGGRYVLADQLRYLLDRSQLPNVTIQVLSLDNQDQHAGWGSFTVLDFTWSGGYVYLQHWRGHNSLEEAQQIKSHTELFDVLSTSALSPQHSIRRINDRIKELDK